MNFEQPIDISMPHIGSAFEFKSLCCIRFSLFIEIVTHQ